MTSSPGQRHDAGRLEVAVDKGGQLRFGQRPYLDRLHIAVAEQHQRGNAANVVLGRSGRIIIDIF